MTDRPTDDDPVTCPTCASPSRTAVRYPCAGIGVDPWHDRPTDDDPSIVERIWSVLDAYGMGVMRKDDLDALNARIRELEALLRRGYDVVIGEFNGFPDEEMRLDTVEWLAEMEKFYRKDTSDA